jgi:hypothetical protein
LVDAVPQKRGTGKVQDAFPDQKKNVLTYHGIWEYNQNTIKVTPKRVRMDIVILRATYSP